MRFWKRKPKAPAFDAFEVLPEPLATTFEAMRETFANNAPAEAATILSVQVDELMKAEFARGFDAGVERATAHHVVAREIERLVGARRREELVAMLNSPSQIPGQLDRKRKNGRRKHAAPVALNEHTKR